MKQLTVEDPFGHTIDYMVISSLADFVEYSQILSDGVNDTCVRLIKSGVNPSRWDHMIRREDADCVVSAGIVSATVKGGVIFSEIATAMSTKLQNMATMLDQGETLLVNTVGGYCMYDDEYHTIISESEFVTPDTHVIKKSTKYINLENDPELESHVVNYLKPIDPNFSYVKKLRDYPCARLTEVLKEFKQNGGEVVYVYTTGLDVPQMEDYAEAIIKSEIKNVEFEFNCGMDENHAHVIKHLENNGCDVIVIGD